MKIILIFQYFISISCLIGSAFSLFGAYLTPNQDPNYLALLAFAIALVSVAIAALDKISSLKAEKELNFKLTAIQNELISMKSSLNNNNTKISALKHEIVNTKHNHHVFKPKQVNFFSLFAIKFYLSKTRK